MSQITQRAIVWAPRILCIALAIFISIFALDVFGEHLPFWRMMLALAMHLVPTAVLVVLLAVSWRWPWIGGVAFVALGFFYMWMTRLRFNVGVYLAISGPAFMIGMLFLANWLWRKELKVLPAGTHR